MNRGPAVTLENLDLSADYHVHSTFSDDASSTLLENLAAATKAELSTIQMVDHVRASSTWVPDFLVEVAALKRRRGLSVLTGVETKVLDTNGHLDLPPGIRAGHGGLDRIVIADHQFPGPGGPWSPSTTRDRLAHGLAPADAIEMLVMAMVRAMRAAGQGQLAHPFSILPKIGLSEDHLRNDHLAALASAAAVTGTLVEINEKWSCPGSDAVHAFLAAGVTMVPASGSHHHSHIGQYAYLRELVNADRASRIG